MERTIAAPEGLAPDSQLSAVHIREILDHLKKYQILLIFPESNVSKDSLRKIVSAADEMGLKVRLSEKSLFADAMGHPGEEGDTYLKMIQYNAKTIVDEMNKTYQGHVNER